jgi:hypothetical protein
VFEFREAKILKKKAKGRRQKTWQRAEGRRQKGRQRARRKKA